MAFKLSFFVLTLALSLVILAHHNDASTNPVILGYYPVILVPGSYSSSIEGKLNKPSVVRPECTQKSDDYEIIWARTDIPIHCVADNIRVFYNSQTHHIENAPGVETRVVGFGSASSVARIGTGYGSDYYSNMIDELTALGYRDNVSLRGAPFDFRKGLNELDEYYAQLKDLVEDTYKKNGNYKVVFIGHDLGSLLVTLFLGQQSQEWKDTHVKSLVSLGGAFGGFVTPVTAYLQTFQKNEELGELVAFTRNFSSNFAQFPLPAAFDKQYVIVQTPSKNYTLSNIKELFDDLNAPYSWSQYQDNYPYVSNIQAPGVELHCIYGNGTSTLSRIVYSSKGLLYGEARSETELGDGLIPLASLKVCATFAKKQSQPVHDVPLSAYSHQDIIRFGKPIEYIKKVIAIN